MPASPYKDLGFVVVKKSDGTLAWQSIEKPLDGGVILLYVQQDLTGHYFNGASWGYAVVNAGVSQKLTDVTEAAYQALFKPTEDRILVEFKQLYGGQAGIHEILSYRQFLEVVLSGSSMGLNLPSEFKGLPIRCSPLHQPDMSG